MLYAAQILATGFAGLIAAGVFSGLDQVRELSGWRWYGYSRFSFEHIIYTYIET